MALLALAAALGVRLWMESRPVEGALLWVDLLHYFYPSARHIGDEFAAGRIPTWNPYLAFGTSHIEDIQLATFYPGTLLFGFLPPVWGVEVFAVAHLTLAAIGIFLLGRAGGLGLAGATIAALALASGEALQNLSGWPAILATAAWAPVAFFGARRVGDAPGLPTALSLAAILGLQLLAGYSQLHLYTVLCLPLFAIPASGLLSLATLRSWLWLGVAEVWAAALGAIALLPAIQAVGPSIRHRSALSEAFYELLPVRLPDYVDGIAILGRGGMVPFFVGAVVPLLVLAGLLARRSAPRLRGPVLVLAIVGVVLSLGRATPIFPLLWKLPISHWLTGPYKWVLFVFFAYVLLAGMGGEALLGGRTDRELGRGSRWLWVVLGGLLLALFPFSWGQRGLGAVLVFVAVVFGSSSSPLVRRLLTVFVLVGIVGGSALGWEKRGATPAEIASVLDRFTPAFRFARSLQVREEAGRLFGLGPMLWFPLRQAEVEGVAQANTMETFQTRRVFEFLKTVREAGRDETRRSQAMALQRSVGGGLVLTPHEASPWLEDFGLERVFTSNAADLWRDRAALPRAYLAEELWPVETPSDALARLGADASVARAAVVESESDLPPLPETLNPGEVDLVSDDVTELRFRVHSEGPALLVLLDAWHPDWQAWVDGEPVAIRRANFVGRAVALPPEAREVVFRFVPRSFHTGIAISLAALVAWLGALIVLGVRGRYAGGPGDRAST